MDAKTRRRIGTCLIGAALLGVVWGGGGGTALAQQGGDGLVSPTAALPNETFYTLTRDLRKCLFPLCGGFFAKSVNQPRTRCEDGTLQGECYVADFDLRALGLTKDQEREFHAQANSLLVRGSISRVKLSGFRVGRFTAQEAWVGHKGVTARGTFYRARDLGVRCVTSPCPSFSALLLNLGTTPLTLTAVDLSKVVPDPSDGYLQLVQPEGVMVAGSIIRGPTRKAIDAVLSASEYYLPFPRAARTCGGIAGLQCGADEICQFEPGQCQVADASGVCVPAPIPGQTLCPAVFIPVCGCDGQTYGNGCEAGRAGVSIDHDGECEAQTCGGFAGLQCGPDQVCAFEPGQCLLPDAAGTCQPAPDPGSACPLVFDPVCGCDGKTYSNTCEAARAGVSIASTGQCRR